MVNIHWRNIRTECFRLMMTLQGWNIRT